MAHDVFISYSSKDKPIADAVVANLEQNNIRCWIAPRDITPGSDWPTAISDAIVQSRVMVLIFSSNSNSSHDVGRELILAANNNLVIIPFKVDNVVPEPGKLYYLARTHWLDAINPPTQKQIDTLVSYTQGFLKDTSEAESQTKAATPVYRPVASKPLHTGINKIKWILWATGAAVLIAAVLLYNLLQGLPGGKGDGLAAAQKGQTTETEATILQPITLTVWGAYNPKTQSAYKTLFSDYTAQHPEVKIVFSDTNFLDSLIADIADPLKAAVDAGQGPDIVIMPTSTTISEIEGSILPLNNYGINEDWLRSVYDPVAANNVIYKRQIWGLPLNLLGIAIFYNKDLVDRDNFPADPLDFNSLRDAMVDYYTANDQPLLCVQDMIEEGSAFFLAPVFFGHGLPTYIDEEGRVYLKNPQAEEALTWLVSVKPYMLKDNGYEQCHNAFINRETAAMWTGYWFTGDFQQAGIDYGILPMGKPAVNSDMIMLTTNAVERHHTDEALAVMKYFTSPMAQKKAALEIRNCYIPAQTDALEDETFLSDENLAGYAAALRLGVSIIHNHRLLDLQWVPIADAVKAAWEGEMTPAEALAEAQSQIENEVAASGQ